MAVSRNVSPAMHFPSHEQKQALLEQVLRIADQRLASAAAKEARAFITHYYDQVDPEDMANRDPEDLYGAALAHLAVTAAAEEDYWNQEIAGHPAVQVQDGAAILDLNALARVHPAVIRRLIRRAVEIARGDLRRLTFDQVEAVAALAAGEKG